MVSLWDQGSDPLGFRKWAVGSYILPPLSLNSQRLSTERKENTAKRGTWKSMTCAWNAIGAPCAGDTASQACCVWPALGTGIKAPLVREAQGKASL